MQCHMQHKMYLAHKREKENRKLQKVFYRRHGMEVQSGSEERIIDEEDWVYKFSTWEIDEDSAGTSSSALRPMRLLRRQRRSLLTRMAMMMTSIRRSSSP